MITILQNAQCYTPAPIGRKNLLIAGSTLFKILEPDEPLWQSPFVRIIPCDGMLAFPGILDGHVHLIGGGGEAGFQSRISEISAKEIMEAGVTTVVGLLGADNQTKSLKSLLAKARALEAEGLSSMIYAGSYTLPPVTLTGDITSDMVLIDKIIGVGEIAISDHRSSHPDIHEIIKIATMAHIGGLISGKAGLVHLHVGDGKDGLHLLDCLGDESDLPMEQFLPTHVNRNPRLFEHAISFAKRGNNIDLTAGEKAGIPVPEAVLTLINKGVCLETVTVSSDANGSAPNGGVGKIRTLYDDIVATIAQENLQPEIVFPLVTENVAKRLAIYPKKGSLCEGSDADIVLVDPNYRLQMLFCMGKLVVDGGKVC